LTASVRGAVLTGRSGRRNGPVVELRNIGWSGWDKKGALRCGGLAEMRVKWIFYG